MSSQLDPIQNPQAWDVIRVGSATSPGICKITGVKRGFEWDVKRGKGSLGATVTFVQRPPAKIAILFRLWTANHFQQWDVFRPLLKFDPTKKSVQAVDIYHPALADIEITSVVVESIGAIEHAGDQLYTVAVELLEYFPPPKVSAIGTPTTSQGANSAGGKGGGTPGTPPPTTDDAQQAEIKRLLQQAQQP